MKKKIAIYTLLALILIALGYYVYELIQFNKVNDQVDIFRVQVKGDYEDLGVYDDRLYYREGTKLVGMESDQTRTFEKHIGFGVKKIIYDKYIYVFMANAQVRALDRKTGKEIRSLELSHPINYAEKQADKLVCYGDKEISILDLNLKTVRENKKYNFNPLKFKREGNLSSIIFLDRDLDGFKSRFQIYDGDKLIYSISSVDEVFLYAGFLDTRVVLLTNRYLYLIENGSLIGKKFTLNPRTIDVKDDKIALCDDRKLKIYDRDLRLDNEIDLGFKSDKISIRNNSMLILGPNMLASLENKNLIKTNAEGIKDYIICEQGVYIVFADRIERAKVY